MKILLTGAAGYAGRGIAGVLRREHVVRGLDIRDAGDAVDEMRVGDIANLEFCRQAVEWVDAVVHCHMARNPDGYQTPVQAIDVNVKGTANLYHASVELGIKRAVLISSQGVLLPEPGADAKPGDGPYNFHYSLYVLTKIMQEDIARFYYEMHGVVTSILRPSWVVYDEDFHTKYGVRMEEYHPHLIDPRDIGQAVLASLALPDPGLEAFQLGQDDVDFDLTATRERLHWQPAYRFTGLPRK